MKLFYFPQYQYLISVKKPGFEINQYANQEPYIKLITSVKGQACSIMGTVAPPSDNLLLFSMLAHCLKKEGAEKVIAVLPYLGYSRQEKSEPNISLGAEWTGLILKSTGIDEILTIDVHSQLDVEVFGLPITSLSMAELFVKNIKLLKDPKVTILAPDKGAINRAKNLTEAADLKKPFAYLEKVRTPKIKHLQIIGNVSSKVLIIDDILDTGSTLLSACKLLTSQGVKEIQIAVSHAHFNDSKWPELFKLGVSKIFTTNSIPQKTEVINNYPVKVISVKNLLVP